MSVGRRGIGGGVPPLLLMLSARPSAWRVGEGFLAAGALIGASSRGRSFCARAISMDDEVPSSSAAGSVYDLAAPYLTVDDIADAANLDEVKVIYLFALEIQIKLKVIYLFEILAEELSSQVNIQHSRNEHPVIQANLSCNYLTASHSLQPANRLYWLLPLLTLLDLTCAHFEWTSHSKGGTKEQST